MKYLKIFGFFVLTFLYFATIADGGHFENRNTVTILLYLLPIVATLLYLREETFNLWWKFSVLFYVISGLVLYYYIWPSVGDLAGGSAGVSIATGVVVLPAYFVLSFLIIGIQSYRFRRKK